MEKNQIAAHGGKLSRIKGYGHLFALAGVAALSFGLNFYAISGTGFGNAYYAAAIRSMTQSFHNFFFAAFDPAGVVSVDKPPLALWVQTIFVLVFGYHGWAMLLPQALAGAGSSILMYVLTARHFGRPAGLTAALVFAVTPAVVVASRNNTMDMQLIFVLLLATWFLFRAVEKSRWRYLFAAAILIGLGFNIKMLQAYMILPAVGVMYLFFSREKVGRRILAGAVSLVILTAVSLAWVLAVDLYPADSRPYVGSSTDNTEMELIIGHNGMERLYGMGGMRAGRQSGRSFGNAPQDGFSDGQNDGNRPSRADGQDGDGQGSGNQPPRADGQNDGGQGFGNSPRTDGQDDGGQGFGNLPRTDGQNALPDDGGDGIGGLFNRGGAGGTGNDIGTPGALRLWGSSMYGQASWLLVLALFCAAACFRRFKSSGLKRGIFAYWLVWLVSIAAFFSIASFYHRYYLCMLAPGIAGIIGVGLPEMFRAFRDRSGWRQWLLPVSLLATAATQAVYVWSYADLRVWLVPVIAVFAAAALALMFVFRRGTKKIAGRAAALCMLVSVLAAPFYWSLTVVMYLPENVTMPYAGPELASQAKTPGMTANQEVFTTAQGEMLSLEKYLVANYTEGSYLVVAQRANDVADFIVDTGLPAVAYGGFLGTDNALTLDRLKELVEEGKITYFLISGQGGGGGGSNSELTSYVKENAALVDPSEYGASGQSSLTLYKF